MNIQGKSSPQEDTQHLVTFLIEEYETLRTLRQDYISMGDNRVNFFLAILSGVTVFLTWLNSLPGSGNTVTTSYELVYFITVVTILGVLLLGLTTFARIIRRNTSINVYTRGLTRIRRYFVEQYPDIEKYIILPINDDKPEFKPAGISEQLPIMLAIINGLIAGASLAIVLFKMSMAIAILVGLVVFITLLFAQLRFYQVRMRDRAEEIPVYFPTEK